MGFFSRWATRTMISTVRASLPNASNEKLIEHYNRLIEAKRNTDDIRNQQDLASLQNEIMAELEKRGVNLS
jgi:hypothetical protein